MENTTLCGFQTNIPYSGFYYNIQTKRENIYEITISATLISGINAFVYCEDNNQNMIINKRNNFLPNMNKLYNFKIKGTNSEIKIGIMITNDKNKLSELYINNFQVKTDDEILSNTNNLFFCNSTIKSENIIKCELTYNNFFNNNDIYQIYISKTLDHFSRIIYLYNLNNYKNIYEPLLTFGLYTDEDYNVITNHKGKVYVLWGGSDANDKFAKSKYFLEKISKNTGKNISHYSISNDLKCRLEKYNIVSTRITLNLVDKNYFKKITSLGEKIYIYNGIAKNRESIYGQHIYEKVIKLLPQYEFVLSNTLNAKYESMPKIYQNCFIGLRLCENDGNANTVQEMNEMGIKVIHNEFGIKWENENDIVLSILYEHINKFNDEIKNFKNILFISTDYPGYGGAATNTKLLIDYYSNKTHHKVFGLFITNDKSSKKTEKYVIYNTNDNKINELMTDIYNYFNNVIDLVIMRNYWNMDIINKNFKCKKYFMVPGIYKQNLSNYWNKITKEQSDEYINNNILTTINNCDKVYVNGNETKKNLKDFYGITTNYLPFNYIPYHNIYPKKDKIITNKKYDIAVIVSDFNRKIKNINLINKIFGLLPRSTKLVIGNNNGKIIGENITRFELLDHSEVLNLYKDISYVINTSFYESCSNVLIEAFYNNCETVKLNDTNYLEFVEKVKNSETNITPQIINKKNKRILIVSTQYPYYGGAATLAYKLHEELVKNNYESDCLFLYDKECEYNPKNISNVYRAKIVYENANDYTIRKFYRKIITNVPNIIICFNYLSPIIIKKIFPLTTMFYYVTGSKHISDSDITAIEYFNDNILSDRQFNNFNEIKSMLHADYIIPNSNITKNVQEKMFPEFNNKLTKVMSFELLFKKNQNERQKNYEHDLLIISSRYDRNVKNIKFVNELYSSTQLKSYNKACIGIDSEKYISTANKHYGFLNEHDLIEVIQKSKIVIITSKYESYSITLVNAISNSAIVVSNNNIGASDLIDNFFVLDNFVIDNWVNKINIILHNYDYFKNFTKTSNTVFEIDKSISHLHKHTTKYKPTKLNVLFVSIDKPFVGGSATNTYNMIKTFQNNNDINPFGLFISNENNDDNINPNNYENIYHVCLNDKIEENLKIIHENITKNNTIDVIFVKNYKSFVIIKKVIKNTKIIFSPSGLKNYENTPTDNIFDENMNVQDFINKYDKENKLEQYVYRNCEIIVPNSNLTFNKIRELLPNKEILYKPINITYIDFEYVNTTNNHNKKYDIAFICYSWKRKVKNYDTVFKVIENLNNSNINILIIGDKQKKYTSKNVTSVQNCSNEQVLSYLKETKILCMASEFDSSPNVVKEAIMCDCDVVLSKNIGSFEYFDDGHIVENIYNESEWVAKIKNVLKQNEKIKLKNFNPQDVKLELINILKTAKNHKSTSNILSNIQNSGVGIYKLPNTWTIKDIKNTETNFAVKKKTNISTDVINDVFFKCFLEHDKYNCKDYHYIYINEKEQTYASPLYYSYPFMNKNIYIWSINNISFLKNFTNANYYFLRGNYYDIYSMFINNKSKIVLYPATSLIYDKTFNLTNNKTINHKFNTILYDDDKNYEKWKLMFPNSHLQKWTKPVNHLFKCYNINREFDYIFVATENQPTKNRNLFLDFINYCENNNISIKVINVGKVELKNYKNIHVDSYDFVDQNTLSLLFNKSKINLLFSGRDALPRVLTESLACGCYNLALDTLSDGSDFFDGTLGTLLSFNINKIYDSKLKSISYESNSVIFDEILKFKTNYYNHNDISLKYFKKLNNVID